MIPTFPVFKRLEITDKVDFKKIVLQFEPYSDHNFVSLWSFDTKEDCEISILNENLVIKMNDYLTLQPFLTFIGNRQVTDSISTLLAYGAEKGMLSELRFIPEVCLAENFSLLQKQFYIVEDRDNFDYVYDLDQLLAAKGGEYKVLRNMMSKFERSHSDYTLSSSDLNDSQVKKEVIELVTIWGEKRNKSEEDISNELTSIQRLLGSADCFDLTCLTMRIDNKLQAFFISEIVDSVFGIAHFRKANPSFSGIFQFIDYENAKHLRDKGCKFLNYEQDLGYPGLRRSKLSLNPIKFQKKYTISKV